MDDVVAPSEEVGRPRPDPARPDRRQVLTAGAAGATGIVSLVLPPARAAATGGAVAPASIGTLTFSDVTTTGFTVSWGGAT